MNSKEIVAQLAERLEMPEEEIRHILNSGRKVIKKLIESENGYTISKLGMFKARIEGVTDGRIYPCITYGQSFKKRIVRFYPGPFLRKVVSGQED